VEKSAIQLNAGADSKLEAWFPHGHLIVHCKKKKKFSGHTETKQASSLRPAFLEGRTLDI